LFRKWPARLASQKSSRNLLRLFACAYKWTLRLEVKNRQISLEVVALMVWLG
jgi:hypothetical protein